MRLNENEIFQRAYDDCMREMYAKSQPMADWDNLVEEYRQGKIAKDERIYERHYLSQKEFRYILDKYIEAYGFKSKWKSYMELLVSDLEKGGLKDVYVEGETAEDGYKFPGHRGTEKIPPIKEQIYSILAKYIDTDSQLDGAANEVTNAVFDTINDIKDFYRFDRKESDFSIAVALGASPTGNAETVKKWWKENYGKDIEIVERNPYLLWEMDEYGDEFEDVMIDEYGENWKEITDKEWKEKEAKEKAEAEKKINELREKLEKGAN